MKNIFKVAGTWLALLALVLAMPPVAMATLTATVTPGYQFGPSETPAIATLNLLGEPSILISGTVDGTTGLTPGSVNGALLADSVVDGITLDYNASSPRAIEIKATGVSSNQLNLNAFSAGVLGGQGQQIRLIVDTNYFLLWTNDFYYGGIAPTNGALGTNNLAPNFPWLTLGTNAIVDTNINALAGIQVTKLQNGGTDGVLVSTPGASNVWASQGLAFVMNSYLATNVFTNTWQAPFTNLVTNVYSAWIQNLQQVVTNIALPNDYQNGATLQPHLFAIPHFYGELPTSVHAWLEVLGTNVITTNIVVGVSTNYFTNAVNITGQFVANAQAIDWKDVYYSPATSSGPQTGWGDANDMPLFTWNVDTNYVYITQGMINYWNYSGGTPADYFWHTYTNPAVGSSVRSNIKLSATNFLLRVTIRY